MGFTRIGMYRNVIDAIVSKMQFCELVCDAKHCICLIISFLPDCSVHMNFIFSYAQCCIHMDTNSGRRAVCLQVRGQLNLFSTT